MRYQKAFRQVFIALILTAVTIASVFPSVKVYAAENISSTDKGPWSEPFVDGWELEWEAGECFDTLLKSVSGQYDISYEYDENGNRAAKTVNGDTTYFVYDENYFLLKETAPDYVIEYNYGYTETFDYILTGFTYNNTEYEYGYTDGKITEIIKDGEPVARYQYYYDICEAVLCRDEAGNWSDRSNDPDFIGNINRIRMKQSYCDPETGWYYCGRYYSPKLIRFIDGISEERAEEIKEEHPEYYDYEVDSKIYTNGVNLRPGKGRAALSQEETVRRVIMLESPRNKSDQDTVGWVIKNRMLSKVGDFKDCNTAYAVVTQPDQFSTYGCNEFNDFSEFASKPLYQNTYKIYSFLTSGNYSLPKPCDYNDQLYFSSISSFLRYSRIEGGTFYYNRDSGEIRCTDCWCIPVGNVTKTNVLSLATPRFMGIFNVFCDKKFISK